MEKAILQGCINMKQNEKRSAQSGAVRRGWGITGKLASAIVVSVIIAVAILFAVVYFQMSHTDRKSVV